MRRCVALRRSSTGGATTSAWALHRIILQSTQNSFRARLPDTTRSPHRVHEFTARRVKGRENRSPENAGQPMVQALQKGAQPTVNDTKSYNNGVKVVPANLLEPLIVTEANAKQAYANNPTLSKLTQ